MRGNTASTETNMKIILNIETNDPADLSRIAAALNGEAVTVTTTKPATARTTKATETPAPTQPQTSATAATERAPDTTQPPATAEQPAAVPAEADLIAAGNAAVAKVGNGGPDKVKKYIAEHFQKADGSPGTLKLTAEPQRAKLLADLQAIGRGEIAL